MTHLSNVVYAGDRSEEDRAREDVDLVSSHAESVVILS